LRSANFRKSADRKKPAQPLHEFISPLRLCRRRPSSTLPWRSACLRKRRAG
jgi:hypothetical protein